MRHQALTNALAQSFLAGDRDKRALVFQGAQTLGRRWRWLAPLAERYLKAFSNGLRPRHREVVHFLSRDGGYLRALQEHADETEIENWASPSARMRPAGAAEAWPVPPILTIGDLGDWLGISPGELEWFADLKALGYKKRTAPLRHYHYRILQKSTGGIRLIEAPKERLKEMQTRVLSGILDRIPPHDAAHGFIKGRSIKTYTAPHLGQSIVLRMDLSDFFPSYCGARVQTMFRTMGYPETVADLLGGICTNAVPRDVWNNCPKSIDRSSLRAAQILYSRPHLPQGAPTSPALANFGAYRADSRLAGLARAAGAEYTRYADDVAFSGDEQFARGVNRFAAQSGAILLEEGFAVNFRKTRLMRRGGRQHLSGLIINQRVNVNRSDFDLLKAILTNCVRHGPETQNRQARPGFRAHLQGRIAFVEMINADKGMRLRRIFENIQW